MTCNMHFRKPTLMEFATAMLQLWPDEEFADRFRKAFKLKGTPRWITQGIADTPTPEMDKGTYLLYDAHSDVIEIAFKSKKIHIIRAIEKDPEIREM